MKLLKKHILRYNDERDEIMPVTTRAKQRKRVERRKIKGVKRKKLGKYLKLQVLSNQDFKCNICFQKLITTHDDINIFDYDHIETHAETGDDSIENIQAICLVCHRIKSVREFRELYRSRERSLVVKSSPIKKKIVAHNLLENRFAKYEFHK